MTSWFRSWHGAPTDVKWRTVARKAGVRPGDVAAVMWVLLDRASQESDRGSVAGYDVEVIADALGFDEAEVSAIIGALIDKGVIAGGRIAAWEKYQPKREDDSRERVAAYRARKKEDVTHCNADGSNETVRNAPETESDTEQTRTESLAGSRQRYPAEFDEFWKAYGPTNGPKKPAFVAWQRLSKADRREAVAGLGKWLASDKWQAGFKDYPQKYLNQRFWENDPVPEPKRGNGHAEDARAFAAWDIVLRALEHKREHGSMPPERPDDDALHKAVAALGGWGALSGDRFDRAHFVTAYREFKGAS